MTIWLTSDPHFGHLKAAQHRGFETTDQHDAALMRTFRKRFCEGDTIYWLGDMALDGWEGRVRGALASLRGTHHLVLGNHDRAHPMHANGHRFQQAFIDCGFQSVSLFAQINYDGQKLLLSHLPYVGDNGTREDRATQWRPPDEGQTIVHGHTHGDERVTFTPKNTCQVHVGLDAWGLRPVTLAEVVAEKDSARHAGW